MGSMDKLFAGPIPEIYDRILVPLLFAPYAEDLADRAARREPLRILEIAAGTGALTRALVARLPAAARLDATDLNQPMLDRAASRLGADSRVAWRQADALALPFADRSFALALCQFGAMFFPDKVEAYRETHRVLEPGGRYLFNVWDALAVNDFAQAVTETLATVFPDDPPRFMARVPHGYHDRDLIRQELGIAGFADIEIETVERTGHAASPEEVATGFCQGTPVRAEIAARAPDGLQMATRAASEALARRFGSGAVAGRMRAHVISAIRP